MNIRQINQQALIACSEERNLYPRFLPDGMKAAIGF
jgi:hypothetical protein